jgi:hypothetical protein
MAGLTFRRMACGLLGGRERVRGIGVRSQNPGFRRPHSTASGGEPLQRVAIEGLYSRVGGGVAYRFG